MSFPNKINYSLPCGYPGDIASGNPRRTAIAPETGFRCGGAGVAVGHFAWVQEDGVTVLNTAPASDPKAIPTGFVLRDFTGIIQSLNDEGTNLIPSGFPAPIMTGGDYWAVSNVDMQAGNSVFANPADGTISNNGTITGFTVARGGSAGQIIMISAPCAPMPAMVAESAPAKS